jgi:hypothetical protein
MDAKSFREKMEALYSGVDPTDRKQDDTALLRDDLIKIKVREAYYLGTYELRSPGNDLLEFYDSMMLRQEPTSKAFSYIPPSVVYHFRYEHNYPKEVFEKKYNFGINRYLKESMKEYYDTTDGTYWGQIYKKRFSWLVDKPSERFVFESSKDLSEYTKKHFGQAVGPKTINVGGLISSNEDVGGTFEHMFWRGKLAGWSIVFTPAKPDDNIWKRFTRQKLDSYPYKTINPVDVVKHYLSRMTIVMTPKGPCFGYEEAGNAVGNNAVNVAHWVRNNKKPDDFYILSKEEYLKYCKDNNIESRI